MAVAQRIEGMERIEKQVEALLTQSKSPNAAWEMWMGTELKQMHPDVWDQCQDVTYDVMHVWKARSNDIGWRELVQQQDAQPDGCLPSNQHLISSSSAVDAAAATTAAAAAAATL